MGFVVLGLLGASLLFGGMTSVLELAAAQSELGLSADIVERETTDIRSKTIAVEQYIGDNAVEPLINAVENVNRLIAQRVFSWSQFFGLIEETLPDDVIVTGLRPEHDGEETIVTINVVARSVADIDEFIERLESTGSFTDVLADEEEITGDRRYRAILRGRYLRRKESGIKDAESGVAP